MPQSRISWPSRAVPAVWVIASLVFALVVGGLAALAIQADRTATLRDAEARAHSLAQIFAEYADRGVAGGENMITAVGPLVAAWDLHDPVAGRAIFEELRTHFVTSSLIGSVRILNSAGISVLDSDSFPSREKDERSTSHFKYFMSQTGAPRETIISPQETDRASGKVMFTLSRAIRDAGGRLHAIIVVAIYSDNFEALYKSAASWSGATVGLYRMNGKEPEVLAQLAATDGPAKDVLKLVWTRSQTASNGVAMLALPTGSWVVGWYGSDLYPGVIAMTSQSVTTALSQWRWRSTIIGGSAALGVLSFMLFAFFGNRAEQASRQVEHQQLLMREVHHRVKNNLAIVAAMVNAAARQTGGDADVRAQFTKLGSHISSMATLYGMMQASPGGKWLELNGMLNQLCCKLSESTGRTVDYLAGAPMMIDVEQAMSVMIIVNELATNSIKHSDGRVAISSAACPEGVSIKVENASGEFPPGFDLALEQGFGLKMARALAASLGGTITTVSQNPAAVALTFRTSSPSLAV